ncbi:hypothetical protein [Cupriavidus sp. RAF12]|uniref:hypothetical protein n=1 Tax=Cupriavidus sp. RAF12 TaxID=3233050 RepID=UPI003F8E227C
MQLTHIEKTSQWPAHPMVCPFCTGWRPFSQLLQAEGDVICRPCATELELDAPQEH